MCLWVPAADLAQVISVGLAKLPTESQLQLVGGFTGFGRVCSYIWGGGHCGS